MVPESVLGVGGRLVSWMVCMRTSGPVVGVRAIGSWMAFVIGEGVNAATRPATTKLHREGQGQ